MNIFIYANTGKMKGFYQDAIAEYQKRLKRYCNIVLFNHPPKNAMGSHGIFLSPKGAKISSEGWAEKIKAVGLNSLSDIRIAIGWQEDGDFEDWERICLTEMTMTAEILTVIVYEQIYRGYRILNNEPYHK